MCRESWGRRVLVTITQVAGAVVLAGLVGIIIEKCIPRNELPVSVLAVVLLFPGVLLYAIISMVRPESRWKSILYWLWTGGLTLMAISPAIMARLRDVMGDGIADERYVLGMGMTIVLILSAIGIPGLAVYAWLVWGSKILFRWWAGLRRSARMATAWATIAAICLLVAWVYMVVLAKPKVRVDYLAMANEMRKPVGYSSKDGESTLYQEACELANQERVPEASRQETVAEPNKDPYERTVWLNWPADMNDTEARALKEWVGTNERALAKLNAVMTSKYFWGKLRSKDGALIDANGVLTWGNKQLAQALVWRAKLRAVEGDIPGALDDVYTLGDMHKCFGKAPMLIEWLMGLTCSSASTKTAREIMAHVTLSEEQLVEISTYIAGSEKTRCGLGTSLAMERLYTLDFLQRYFTDAPWGSGRISIWRGHELACGSTANGDALMIWMMYYACSGDRDAVLKSCDTGNEKLMALSDTPPYKLKQDGVSIENIVKVVTMNDPIAASRCYDSLRAVEFLQQHRNDVAGMQALIAVMRYKGKEGRLPDTLDDLTAKGYLREVPIDLFSGKPFVYRRIANDFKLYSVGKNGVDDGGVRATVDMVLWPVR
jgi:hypothetical protein